MASHSSSNLFRLNSVDRHGRKIDPTVLVAAEEVFSRALEHGMNMFCDPAVIANALEEIAADVSRRLEEKNGSGKSAPIRNLPGYVFHAFVRHLNRLKSKELVLVRGDGTGQTLASTACTDPSAQFETKILVDECLAQCDFVTRDMFWRRVQGFSWEEIGKIHRLSAHAAEVRFRHAVRAAQARLTNERRSLPCRTPAEPTEEPKPAMRSDVKKQTTGI
jgi:hypothetical protein